MLLCKCYVHYIWDYVEYREKINSCFETAVKKQNSDLNHHENRKCQEIVYIFLVLLTDISYYKDEPKENIHHEPICVFLPDFFETEVPERFLVMGISRYQGEIVISISGHLITQVGESYVYSFKIIIIIKIEIIA